jgi:hypothetical protein
MKKVYVRVFAAVVIGLFGSIVGCAQARPDLIVRGAVITKDASGLFVDKITVVVMNTCSGSRGSPFVRPGYIQDQLSTQTPKRSTT